MTDLDDTKAAQAIEELMRQHGFQNANGGAILKRSLEHLEREGVLELKDD